MVGLSLCLALVSVVLGLVVLERSREGDVAAGPVEVARSNPAGAAAALHELVEAVEARDEDAASALAGEGDGDGAALLSAVARNAELLDLRDVSARYVSEVGTVAEDGGWTALVALTWRLGGFDASVARTEVLVTFTPRGGGTDSTAITGFGGEAAPGRRTPLWLQGPLTVVRRADPRVLVLVDGPRPAAQDTAERVVRGIDVVRRTLPDWRAPAVVEVPASAAALDEVLGAAPGTYAGVAAVTASVDGSPAADAPTHVFVNPDVSSTLRPAGSQVVMSHELTHLATDAARSTAEPWLVEGFADWVALRDVRLGDATTLGRAIALVRREGVPAALPGPAELDARAPDLVASYEMAWLACRMLAERLGADGLVRLYRRVDAGAALTRELRRSGVPVEDLTRLWQDRLRDLAS